jgi:hypothetical protein
MNFASVNDSELLHSYLHSTRYSSSVFGTDERDLHNDDDDIAERSTRHQSASSVVMPAPGNEKERFMRISPRELTTAVVHFDSAITLPGASSPVQTSRKQCEKDITSDILRQIEQWLPAHCCPDDVMPVEEMPFTKHGTQLVEYSVPFLTIVLI